MVVVGFSVKRDLPVTLRCDTPTAPFIASTSEIMSITHGAWHLINLIFNVYASHIEWLIYNKNWYEKSIQVPIHFEGIYSC